MQFFKKFIDDSVKWCKGKFPYFRALLLLYFVYILFRYLSNPDYNSFFNGLNLGIHELGHFIFSPFGEFMHFLGGSLTEIIFPIIGILMFYFQKDYFAISVGFGWFATALFHVATYVADARRMELPLVSPFGTHPIHDWNYILSKTGLLSYDLVIANFLRFLGYLSIFFCVFYGIFLLFFMFKPHDTEEEF